MAAPFVSLTAGCPFEMAGFTYFAPKSARYPSLLPGVIVASYGFAFGVRFALADLGDHPVVRDRLHHLFSTASQLTTTVMEAERPGS